MANLYKKIARSVGLIKPKSVKDVEHLSGRATNFQKSLLKEPGAKQALRELYKIPKSEMRTMQKALMDFIKPSEKQMMKEFQTGVVDPTTQLFNQQIKPGITEQFSASGSGYSSALNDALGRAASDMSIQMGSMLPAFMQQQRQNKMTAMSALPTYRQAFLQPMQQGLQVQGNIASGTPIMPGIPSFTSFLGQSLGNFMGSMQKNWGAGQSKTANTDNMQGIVDTAMSFMN